MRFVRWLPALLWALVILFASGDTFSSDSTADWLNAIVGATVPELVNVIVRKGGHVAGYSILAVLLWLADRRVLRPLLISLAVAAIDETKQSFTLFREGSFFDVVLDSASAALALLLLEKYRYVRAMKQ